MSSEGELSSPPSTNPAQSTSTRREGNDSLWKRARRTLGTQNLAFLNTTSKAPGASATGSGPAAPNKRREQVRHAQRTHRQRTQNYIKTLESEVVRLRESEAKLMTERDNLKTTVQTLKTTITSANLPLPNDIDTFEATTIPPSSSPYDMPAKVTYANDDFDHPRLHVSWPDPSQPPAPAYSEHGFGLPQQFGDQSWFGETKPLPDLPNDLSLDQLSVSGGETSPPRQNVYAPIKQKSPTSIDTLETAIDFVLALEHPCMAHIPYPADPGGNDPANHMMLASTPLIARAPRNPTESPDTSWMASSGIIKQLLNLSQSINLQGEITPVEAWQILHNHPYFPRMSKSNVDTLKRQLCPHVQCCGFGAILDEAVFWYYFNQHISAPPQL